MATYNTQSWLLLQFSATSIIVSHEPTSGTPCSSWILVFGLVNFLEKFASNIDTLQQQYITMVHLGYVSFGLRNRPVDCAMSA